jgi:ferrous-iron efflux pump FieF
VLTLALLLLQRHVIAQTGSTAIRADAVHYASDLLSNLAIIAALLIAPLGWPWIDPLFALGVALYIGYHALRVGQDAIQQLLDRELPAQQQQQILTIAKQRAAVRGVHDLRTRQSGRVVFIQLHLELDDNLPLYQAHAIADQVELDICEVIPTAQVIVHQDPASVVASGT